MSFLNLALLGGVAAFVVPLAIHLLNRSRHQSIEWGAMHLLEAALQVNSRRMQWESILLLLLRCLIPILFAIGLARPVFTSLKSSIAQGQVSILTMLDNSLSMQAADQEQPKQTRYERAVGEIRQVLSQQQRAEMSVWSSGGGPINVVEGSTVDPNLALRSLAKIQPGAGPSEPIAILEAAIAQLNKMANTNRQLVIASDFQTSQWGSLSAEQMQRLQELLGDGPSPIQLSLLPVAGVEVAGPGANLSVELSPESREGQLEPIFANDPIRIVATLHNWGNQPATNARVMFEVDENLLASETVDLLPNSKQQVQFACSFKSTGKHLFSIRVQTPTEYVDGLAGDNSSSGILLVREPIQVVVVDPSAGTSASSTGKFLQLALSPATNNGGFQVRLLSRMPPVEDLRELKVLAFVGSNFDDNQAKHLVDFVERGGGLLVVPDDKLDWGRLNRLWYEQFRLLPARFMERKSSPQDPLKIKQKFYQQQSLSIFNGSEYGDLTSIVSQQWHALEVERDAGVNPKSESLIMLENDDAVVAKGSIGRGSVVQFGVSPDPKWSNLSTRPAFVPLIQRLVLDLVGEGAQLPQQVLTGQALALTADQFQLLAGQSEDKPLPIAKDSWSLIDPNGDRVRFAVGSMKLDFTNGSTQAIDLPVLRWPGVYRISAESSQDAATAFAAVAVPSNESDPQVLDSLELEQLSKQLGATIVRSANEYKAVQQVRRDGREIWRPLLILLLVFLFAEIFLARRITRGV